MASLSPDLAAPGLALRKQSMALLVDILARGAASGRFALAHATVTAAAISALGQSVPAWYAPGPGLDVDALVEASVELAVRMVGAQPGPR